MPDDRRTSFVEVQNALALFRTWLSYLKDGGGHLMIKSEVIPQLGVPLFPTMAEWARFTEDSEILKQI